MQNKPKARQEKQRLSVCSKNQKEKKTKTQCMYESATGCIRNASRVRFGWGLGFAQRHGPLSERFHRPGFWSWVYHLSPACPPSSVRSLMAGPSTEQRKKRHVVVRVVGFFSRSACRVVSVGGVVRPGAGEGGGGACPLRSTIKTARRRRRAWRRPQRRAARPSSRRPCAPP